MKVRIGSRDSKLAVIQSQIVIEGLKKAHMNINTELITMKTTGDIILDRTLDKIGGKGLFVKELDKALLEGKSDISVHSLKDMPMDISEDMPIIAYLKRENPYDVLILPSGETELDKNKPIGTSSKRRISQLKKIYTNFDFKPIRGNLITRLEKLDNREYSGLILAYAGIKRLGLEHRIHKIFTKEEIIPACGQGIIAVQGIKGKDYKYLEVLNDEKAEYEGKCERIFVKALEGGCSLPIAGFAQLLEGYITLTGFFADEEEKNYIIESKIGKKEDFIEIAIELAKSIKEKVR